MSCSVFTLLDPNGERTVERVLCWACANYQTVTPWEPRLKLQQPPPPKKGQPPPPDIPLAQVGLPCEHCGGTDEDHPPRGVWRERPRFYRLPFTPAGPDVRDDWQPPARAAAPVKSTPVNMPAVTPAPSADDDSGQGSLFG